MANIVDIVIKGVDKSKQAFTTPIKNLKDLQTAAKQLGPAFKVGVTAAVSAIGLLVNQEIKAQSETKKVADRLGFTTEALSTLRFAAEQTGVGVQTFDMAMQRFTRRAAEAADGTGEAEAALAKLGIQLKDSEGNLRPTEELFKEVADGFSKIEDNGTKVRLAFKLFDSEGVKLVNTLSKGRGAIEGLQQQARDLGIEIESNTAANSEKLADNLNILSKSGSSFANAILDELSPGLVALSNDMTDTEDKTSGLKMAVNGVASAVSFLGKVFLSIFEGVGFVVDAFTDSIASLGVKLYNLVTGNFDAIKAQDKLIKDELVNSLDRAAKNIDAIWNGQNKKRVEGAKKTGSDLVEVERATAAEQLRLQKARIAKQKEAERQAAQAKLQREQVIGNAQSSIIDSTFKLIEAGSKKDAQTQKNIALGKAIINTAVGVTKAFELGWPLGLIAGASVAAAGAAEIAAISSQSFAEGGMVQGNTSTGDRVRVNANAGELILNQAQQQAVLAGMSGGGSTKVEVYLEGETILDFISQSSKNGRLMIDAGAVR